MRQTTVLLAGILAIPLACASFAQDALPKLNLVIVEGEGAINNIHQRTAREPIVQVEDENHKPVAGAAVVFSLPTDGAGGSFSGGAHSLTAMTNAQGRAVAHGLHPNHVAGQYQIHVNASYQGRTANTTINQTNLAAGAAGAATAGISTKVIVILAVAAAAAAGGALYATGAIGGGSSSSPATPTASLVTISAGAGSVGSPR